MERSYKFRIYPTAEQETLIRKTFGCCRFVYNYFLNERINQYNAAGKSPSKYDQSKSLTKLKKQLTWLREVDATALQTVLRNLDDAYSNFFRRVKQGDTPGYPKFKSKRNPKQSYTSMHVGNNIRILKNGLIKLPKLGEVKACLTRKVKGRILSTTISRTPGGKYYISFCCTDVDIKPLPQTGKNIGLDMGIKTFAAASDGTTYPNPKYLAKSLDKLAELQRKLSRKPKGSKRREKLRLKIARLHEHISNQRTDMLQKLSAQLIRENDVICLEDLATQNMMKNHILAKSIADVSWSEFRRMLEYRETT